VFGIAPPTPKKAPSHPPPLVLSPQLLALLEGEHHNSAATPSAFGFPPASRGMRASPFMHQQPSQESSAGAVKFENRGPSHPAIRHILHVQRACKRNEVVRMSDAPYLFGAR
jgi:hypothetical protein